MTSAAPRTDEPPAMGYLRKHPDLSMIPVGVQSGDKDTTLPDGVAFVLTKPVDVDGLLALVRHHCD